MQPQYEEIGSIYHQAHYAANPICCESTPHGLLQRHDSETIFEDLSENLRRQERRPAPTEKPPAPPSLNYSRQYQQVHVGQRSANHGHQSNSDSSITDELCSASDVELEAQLGIPLPMEVVQTRQQSANDLMGRESGYGTGSKAKLANHWHSPPQLLRVGRLVTSKLIKILVISAVSALLQTAVIHLSTTLPPLPTPLYLQFAFLNPIIIRNLFART